VSEAPPAQPVEPDPRTEADGAPATPVGLPKAFGGGCGMIGGALMVGCFPIVLLAAAVLAWYLPAKMVFDPGDERGAALLDQLSVAQERWYGGHGGYVAAPPCPAEVPSDAPAPFPGDCLAPWTELAVPWAELDCQLSVELDGDDSYRATAECLLDGEATVWQAVDGEEPHRAPSR
jgi:hypothetical protein